MVVSIIVPTLNRPRQLQALINNIAATTLTDNYELVILIGDGDVESWNVVSRITQPGNVRILAIPDAFTPIQAWNYGLKKSIYPWVFLGADDIEFPSYWLEDTVSSLNQGFIALPDNGGSLSGVNWEPHFMVTRDWLRKYQNGVLTIPHYRHWGTDVETCERASRSNTFARSRVIIKHNHWLKDASLIDSTYQKAQPYYQRDMMLYETRKSMGFPDDFEPVLV